jgi:hypothetical protein
LEGLWKRLEQSTVARNVGIVAPEARSWHTVHIGDEIACVMEKVGNERGRKQSEKMKALLLWHSKDYFPYAFSYVCPTSS